MYQYMLGCISEGYSMLFMAYEFQQQRPGNTGWLLQFTSFFTLVEQEAKGYPLILLKHTFLIYFLYEYK